MLNMVCTLRFSPLQNAICFIILTYLVPVLFTFYIQGVLKLKKKFQRQKVNIRLAGAERSTFIPQVSRFCSFIVPSLLHIRSGKAAFVFFKNSEIIWFPTLDTRPDMYFGTGPQSVLKPAQPMASIQRHHKEKINRKKERNPNWKRKTKT